MINKNINSLRRRRSRGRGGGGGYERKGGRKKGQGIGERRKGTAFPSFLSDTTRDFGSQRNPRGR